MLKQLLHTYRSKNSPMFICFLDASKAFDRVRHFKLFQILTERKVPVYLIRLLAFWYSNQDMCVKWNHSRSNYFSVTNGVRQGSLLSPALFNVYLDKISQRLNTVNSGCCQANHIINHLIFADDMCLFAPSAKGLQRLLYECQEEASFLEILYNTKKTVCMCIQPKDWKLVILPKLYLYDKPLIFVDSYKYLGAYINNSLKDDIDIQRQIRSLYARANILARKFSNCSREVKINLFKAYCCNTYCSQLWSCAKVHTLSKLKVAYNNAFRIVFGFPKRYSASKMFVDNGVLSYGEFLRKEVHSFWKRLLNSENVIVKNSVNSMFGSMVLYTYKRWVEIVYKEFNPG